jgi:hypothetical protein
MRETLTQHPGLVWAVLCGLAAIAVIGLVALRRRVRRRRAAPRPSAARPRETAAPAPPLDDAALTAAVHEAEARGETDRLPALYLSLAQCRIEARQMIEGEELLRKTIRGAMGAKHKEIHAKARLALGDLAHAHGDLTTACEHWQIARALFFELKQRREHAAVETRMLRNGCPTDWVLTDF